MVEEFYAFRQELRETIKRFGSSSTVGDHATAGGLGKAQLPTDTTTPAPSAVNIYIFGPQGSGKTSFIRTLFRALLGEDIPQDIRSLEIELHRTDDGTGKYSVYNLTNAIRIHDTRGQREYSEAELEQLKLVKKLEKIR